MALIQLLIIFSLFKSLEARYSFYYTTQRPESNLTFDCWYALVVDHTVDQKNSIPFAELYRTGVTSVQLFDWTEPIDIAERYEINGQYSNEIFHNCSSSWFGSTCQYRLENDEASSFLPG
ncbi:unnamed protein product [Rotaria socialis]|uniref:Uncharacterized protein n=1 Tax=Rotaria socialis TaxID=392032 RepID=A0A820T566_9BILA|nr:unnamed protein product [Rotaria socialis]CAF4460154.1 unnamed protein product [Rotaria socialis]CAF4486086.1 unnamed protein product [Rotaria socialis]CAF4737116.1 unnamed protein product [Rotaria socialis]CAF4834747.1 unnamed protein product [Rotaria socialis]